MGRPMYPNFPQQLMDDSAAELYWNVHTHFLGSLFGVFVPPEYEVKDRPALKDTVKLKELGIGTSDDLRDILRNLIGAKSSLSETDKEDLTSLLTMFKDEASDFVPHLSGYKENLCFVAVLLKDVVKNEEAFAAALAKFNTSTDILRLAVAFNKGDVSMAKDTKFVRMRRSIRKSLLQALNNTTGGNALEDMFRFKEQWLRLGEVLHPGEVDYRVRFPKSFEYFSALRANEKGKTFGGQVVKAIDDGSIAKALSLLVTRPGELARRLDKLFRIGGGQNVLSAFESVVDKISTPVVLQVKNHFEQGGCRDLGYRPVFPKGNVAKMVVVPVADKPLPGGVAADIVRICRKSLVERFKALPPMGKVFIDMNMLNMFVPFSQRSASRAINTIVRGSRVALPEGKDTIRFFLWWKNMEDGGRVDIDLSSVMYDENWHCVGSVSYMHLREVSSSSRRPIAVHSGDITDAPRGACEFIDVDLARHQNETKARYIVMDVRSYTSQQYKDVPECSAGWMMREFPGSGEIFEAKTVMERFDLTAEATEASPAIIDLKTREVIWCDLARNNKGRIPNNIFSNMDKTTALYKAMAELRKPNVYDLLELHVEARGTLVEDPADADIRVAVDGDIKPSDTARLMSEFLV
jgi:hypothetical protein